MPFSSLDACKCRLSILRQLQSEKQIPIEEQFIVPIFGSFTAFIRFLNQWELTYTIEEVSGTSSTRPVLRFYLIQEHENKNILLISDL